MLVKLGLDYTYEQLVKIIYEINRKYGTNVKKIGMSCNKRYIYTVKLGKGEKSLICVGGIHGRERINPVVLLKIIEEYSYSYCNNYEWFGYDLKKMLDKISIIFVPLLNPDGYCKAKNNEFKIWKENARGIDINRNFISDGFMKNDIMKMPDTEPETKALINLLKSSESVGIIDFHSRGKIIHYYRQAMNSEYNNNQWKIAKKLCEVSGYEPAKYEMENTDGVSGGNSVNYYSEYIFKPAFTVETVGSDEKFPLDESLQYETYSEIKKIPIEFIKSI